MNINIIQDTNMWKYVAINYKVDVCILHASVIHLGVTVLSLILILRSPFYLIIIDSPALYVYGTTVGSKVYMLCMCLAGPIVFTDVLAAHKSYLIRSTTHEYA
jgi:hypothetical protein